jgi:hypothetical protein
MIRRRGSGVFVSFRLHMTLPIACPFSIGADRCQALSDFFLGPMLMSVAGSTLLFGIGTEALP